MSKPPRRLVRMFKPRFAFAVGTGTKCQTVRPWPKLVKDYPKVGDVIDCRYWCGAPYRSAQVKLGTATITEVEPVMVDAEKGIGFLDVNEHVGPRWVWLMPDRAQAFALADGFGCLAEMLEWFAATHGLPFEGMLIKWSKVSAPKQS